MSEHNYLSDTWALYFHDPYDYNWDLKSYKMICNISTIQDFVTAYLVFKDLFYKGMFFIMRENITPRWEDDLNKTGGCFSYKISKFNLEDKFFEVCCQVLGEKLAKTSDMSQNINGVSISPKKNAYIIRIWIKDNKHACKSKYDISIPKFSTLMYKNHE